MSLDEDNVQTVPETLSAFLVARYSDGTRQMPVTSFMAGQGARVMLYLTKKEISILNAGDVISLVLEVKPR